MVRKRIVLEGPEGDILFWGYSQAPQAAEPTSPRAANDADAREVREPSHSGIYVKELAKTGS